jgi:D-alanine-D-alanine ligase
VPKANGFPCIVKPADEDGSAFIDHDSICEDDVEVGRVRTRMPGPVVVQEFLPGREFAISLWGQTEPDYISIGETRFQHSLRLITYSAKWEIDSADFANSPLSYDVDLDAGMRSTIAAVARGAWRAVGARGCLRVDVRLDATGEPKVLDVNPNPETAPEVGIYRAVLEAGWTWKQFVQAQLTWA